MADLHTNIECLKNACKNPRAQLDKYLAAGKKVIGCFEPYTPEELVHASGMIPMGLWGGTAWGMLAFLKATDTRQNASFAVRLPSRRELRGEE